MAAPKTRVDADQLAVVEAAFFALRALIACAPDLAGSAPRAALNELAPLVLHPEQFDAEPHQQRPHHLRLVQPEEAR